MFNSDTKYTVAAIVLFILFVLVILAISFGIIYVIAGWVNAGFHLGLTDTQLLIATVVAWVVLSALGGRGAASSRGN